MKNTKRNLYQTGNSESDILIFLAVLALLACIVLWLFGFNYHSTSEGSVKYDDCRVVVNLQPDDWQTYFGTFTGYTLKTKSGRIMGGEFVRIENDGSFFGGGHTCAKAYVYQKKQDDVCTGSQYPRLGYDDMCHENY
jgi:hypothetical protein